GNRLHLALQEVGRQERPVRAVARYKTNLENKAQADLENAISRFAFAWKKQRSRTIAGKLAAKQNNEAVKAATARNKANAKVRAAACKAAVLVKAKSRKVVARIGTGSQDLQPERGQDPTGSC